MHSLRRAVTRASLTSAISTAAATSAAPRTQSISFALRSANALRCFSVAAPRAFSRSAALGDENQEVKEGLEEKPTAGNGVREVPPPSQYCIFVQNYSFDVSRQDMIEAFSKFGEVVQVDMPPRKSYCFVYFKHADSVGLAIDNVDNTFWHGRRLSVRESTPKTLFLRTARPHRSDPPPVEVGPPTRTLYIGNISYDATDVELNELFATLNDVRDVRVAVDKSTGWPRGFAHADFNNLEQAKAGLEAIQGKYLRGRPLRVNYAQSASKNDARPPRRAPFPRKYEQAQAAKQQATEEQAETVAAEAEEQKKDQTVA